MTATLLDGVSFDDGVVAVLVGSRGFWVTDHVAHYSVASDRGGPAFRVWCRDGKARECECGRKGCVHAMATDVALKQW